MPDANANDTLVECFLALKRIFIAENTNFGSTLVIPNYIVRLQALEKVRSVVNFKFINKSVNEDTREYSAFALDIQANTKNGILSFPEDVCWELKYPNFDIVGRTA